MSMGVMPGPSPDIWSEVARLRHELADRMEGLSEEQWSADSWCAGWRVGDVFGHLVYLAEATHRSVTRDAVRNGIVPDRFLDRKARELGSQPVSFLARRLRAAADGRYHALRKG